MIDSRQVSVDSGRTGFLRLLEIALVVLEDVSQLPVAADQCLQVFTRGVQERLEALYSGAVGSSGLVGKRLAIQPGRVFG